jgi:salicylate 5-hydroxylase small subunit
MLHDRVYGITETLFHEPYYQRHLLSISGIALDGDDFRVETNYVVVRTKAGATSEVYNADTTWIASSIAMDVCSSRKKSASTTARSF